MGAIYQNGVCYTTVDSENEKPDLPVYMKPITCNNVHLYENEINYEVEVTLVT